eukprot:15360204-Ditylum_brightwellii.AAC.2
MERCRQNKLAVCNKDNDVDNSVDNVDDGDDDCDDCVDNHFAHLSQAAGCCLTERSKQNKHN